MDKASIWLSRKGINYILAPKRGAYNLINPKVCSCLTAKGQSNWIGTFISPNIDHIEHDNKLGGVEPTVIHMKDGTVYSFDGREYRNMTELKRLGNIYGEKFGTGYAGNVRDKDGLAPTLMCMEGGNRQPMITEGDMPDIRIRKLTPRECWRLMTFEDSDFDKAEKVNSATQLYKQAGNSICVDLLALIFKPIVKGDENE